MKARYVQHVSIMTGVYTYAIACEPVPNEFLTLTLYSFKPFDLMLNVALASPDPASPALLLKVMVAVFAFQFEVSVVEPYTVSRPLY